MISIIVYGRNDDRGYGMVKRVAISLNAMAHVLSAPTSEILFVDYNTPDHLPTLPEAIADTLTPAARARLRIFRLRHSSHERFADMTPLPVLEPVARNVALRRSRARNRWILSTNTDSVIALRGAASLEQVVANLPKRSFGVPRFELPERVWESFDRSDPERVIESARAWGKFGRLDEAVWGEGDVLFDGPGDFQLVPRSELFAIDGFDESMLLGWHIDHNLAVRLAKRLGPCEDLSHAVALYHCGHVRQATQTHGHDRVENDTSRFVQRVSHSDLPGQRDAWGCPDDLIEEITLERPPELLTTVRAIMPPLDDEPIRARFGAGAFNNYWYDAGHVTTHVLDLVSSFPREVRFGFAGVRRDILALLCNGLARLGFDKRLMVPAPLAHRLGVDAPAVEIVDPEVYANFCDLPLFEFGLIRDEEGAVRSPDTGVELTAEEADALEIVSELFQQTANAEGARQIAGRAARLYLAVNTIHNRYEAIIASQLAAVASPYSTRLRYGPLRAERAALVLEPLALRIARLAGLPQPPSALEIMQARGLLRSVISDADTERTNDLEIAAASEIIDALLADGAIDRLSADARKRLAAGLEAARRPRVSVPVAAERPANPPGLASLAAWLDPVWRAGAQQIADRETRGLRKDGWIWERAQILWAAARHSASHGKGKALVVSEHSDPVVGTLDGAYEQVDVIDVRRLTARQNPALTRLVEFAAVRLTGRSRFRVLERLTGEGPYDCVILPHSAAFRGGVAGLSEVIAAVRPLMAEGGLLALAGEIGLEGRLRPQRPDPTLGGPKGFSRILRDFAALASIEPFPGTIARADAALVGLPADLAEGRPVLGVMRDGDIFWPAVWLFEAVRGPIETHNLHEAMRRSLLGEQILTMRHGANARYEDGAIVASSGEAGHVIFGPYLSMPAGLCRAKLDLEGTLSREGAEAKLVGEVALGPQIVVQRSLTIDRMGSFSHAFEMDFISRVDGVEAGDGEPLCEVRLWTDGAADLKVRSVKLELCNSGKK